MTNITLDISALPAQNPAINLPQNWIYTSGSGAGRINDGVGFYPTSGAPSGWSYSGVLVPDGSNEVSFSQVVAGTSLNSYNTGVTLSCSAGIYYLEKQPYSTKIYRISGVSINDTKTQLASVSSSPPEVGKTLLLSYNVVTGQLKGYYEGVLAVSATDALYSGETFRGGFVADGYNNFVGISSATAYNVALTTITSINGSNPITAGQTGIAVIADGFTAKPTAVTATYESGAKSILATIGAGTATNFVINIQDRVDGEDWPLNNSVVTFTFTYGSETASLNKNIVKKAAEVVYTFGGAVTNDPQSIAYHLTQDGFTAEGGEHVYLPYGDLVLTAEGGWTVTNAGTFTSWFRPAAGTGAGNVYEYQWQVTEAGISPISSKAITAKALSCAGLSASGFVCTPM